MKRKELLLSLSHGITRMIRWESMKALQLLFLVPFSLLLTAADKRTKSSSINVTTEYIVEV